MAKKVIKQDKTPIAVVLTDTHLKKGNEELVTDIFKQAISLCEKLGIDRLFHAGDFFTARNAQPLDVLDAADDIFEMISDAGIVCDIIPGNHDKTDLESKKSYLKQFRKHVNVIDDYQRIVIGDVAIHFIPYFKENTVYGSKLSKVFVSKEYKNVLITHIAVTGVKNNDYSEVENDLKPEMFKQFDSILIGHYHNQSQVGDNIFYIGSSYQANYGEDNKKGFIVLYSDGSHEFIKSNFPEYIKVTINASDKKRLKEVQKELAHSKDHVRVVVEGTTEECKSIDKGLLMDLGIDVKFDREESRIQADQEFIAFDRNNIKQYFEEFCEKNQLQNIEMGRKYIENIL